MRDIIPELPICLQIWSHGWVWSTSTNEVQSFRPPTHNPDGKLEYLLVEKIGGCKYVYSVQNTVRGGRNEPMMSIQAQGPIDPSRSPYCLSEVSLSFLEAMTELEVAELLAMRPQMTIHRPRALSLPSGMYVIYTAIGRLRDCP